MNVKPITDFRPPSGYTLALEERNFSTNPVGYCSGSFDLPPIPRSEWADRIREMEESQSSLVHLREIMGPNGGHIPALDQQSTNFCWAYSSVGSVMMTRAVAGQPYVALSGTSVGAKIKNFRNQGGWGSQSLEFIASEGVCTQSDWPEGMVGLRREFDTPMAWQTAKQFRIEKWMDLDPRDIDQLMACLLRRIPVVSDFNWWRHSVLTMRAVSWNGRNLDTDILNSWGDRWGTKGLGRLSASKAIPDGMIAPKIVTAS